MRKQSGICIKSNKDRSLFLKADGQFVKGIPVGYAVKGEETFFYPFEKKPVARILPTMAPIMAAIAAIALFMSALIFPTEEAYGYVQVQINPGVELGVNEDYKVISVRELNSDGRELIHQMGDWENNSLQTVLNRVLDLAVKDETRDITITAVEEDNPKAEKTIKKVILALSLDIESKQVAIQMKEATKEQWRHAKKDQIPVGQIIEKAETVKNQVEPKEQLLPQEEQVIPIQMKDSKNKKEKKDTKVTTQNKSKSKEPSQLPVEKKEAKSQKEKNPQNTSQQKPESKESTKNKPSEKPQKNIEPTKPDSKDKHSKKEEKEVRKIEKEIEKKEKKIQKDSETPKNDFTKDSSSNKKEKEDNKAMKDKKNSKAKSE